MRIYNEKEPYIKITSFYALSLNGYDMHPHAHESFEIMYVTKGNCLVYIGQKEYALGEEQFILIDRGISHRLLIPENQRCSLMNVEFCTREKPTHISMAEVSRISENYRRFGRQEQEFLILGDNMNFGLAMKDLIAHLEKEIRKRHNRKEKPVMERRQEYDYLTGLLFQRMILELCGCEKGTAAAGTAYVQRACAYIEEHLNEELRVPEIAEYAGVHKSYLHALFLEQMDCTIIEYVNRKRLEQAEFLLLYSSLSVTEIAFRVGYNSRQHFGNRFEQLYGESPKNYRQLYRKKEIITGDINGKEYSGPDEWHS